MTDELPPLMGSAEVSELCGVAQQTVSKWRRRGAIPEADQVLRCGPIWRRSIIERWARQTGRFGA